MVGQYHIDSWRLRLCAAFLMGHTRLATNGGLLKKGRAETQCIEQEAVGGERRIQVMEMPSSSSSSRLAAFNA